MNNLTDKVAYITGGSKGIGYGIAKTLLDNGMKVSHYKPHDVLPQSKHAESLSNDPLKVLALESNVSSLTDRNQGR